MNEDLKIIKKKYGEKMMHLCRNLFPSLLEKTGLLSNLMLSNFEPTRFLYDDIVENFLEVGFKNYIYSLVDVEKKIIKLSKTPQELLDEAGYYLYKCESEKEIQAFRKYYAKGEELCTFNGGRLNRCHVFFAVKKNVDEIKRENFKNPNRQDEYGTSVISIQFTKDDYNTLSIKNRYNHTVNNPDATFSNNLDNIIPGLTDSFSLEYNLNLEKNKCNFEIPGYVLANDGKYYKYNYEINNIYYCPNNIIIDNFSVVDKYRKCEKYIVIDYFILDLVKKELYLYDNNWDDSFVDDFLNIDKISIVNSKATSTKTIEIISTDGNEIKLKIDKFNKIVEYYNKQIVKVLDYFLSEKNSLIKLDLPNLIEAGDDFLAENTSLISLNLPKLKKVGNKFLYCDNSLIKLDLLNLTEVGDDFLAENTSLSSLSLPKLKKVGKKFLYKNNNLLKLDLPSLTEVARNFLDRNDSLISLNLPNVTTIDDYFLSENNSLVSINLPNLMEVGNYFLYFNNSLTNINLPKLTKVTNCFLFENKRLISLNLPNLMKVGDDFLYENNSLTNLELAKLIKVGDCFFYKNNNLKYLNLPNLIEVGDEFLHENNSLINLELAKLIKVGDYFLHKNNSLKYLNLPNLIKTGHNFLDNNINIISINLPSLIKVDYSFFGEYSNESDIVKILEEKRPKLNDFSSPINKIEKMDDLLEEQLQSKIKNKNCTIKNYQKPKIKKVKKRVIVK